MKILAVVLILFVVAMAVSLLIRLARTGRRSQGKPHGGDGLFLPPVTGSGKGHHGSHAKGHDSDGGASHGDGGGDGGGSSGGGGGD